jgi:hypothetical protein
LQCDQKNSLMVESRDKDAKGSVLHRSYMRKDEPKAPEKKPEQNRPPQPPNSNDQQRQQQDPPRQQPPR